MKKYISIICFILTLSLQINSQNFTSIDVYNAKTGSGTGFVDIDSDGDQDLLQISASGNFLWRNDGNDTFVKFDSSEFSNLIQKSIGLSCADYDNDGDVDIYLANASSDVNPQYGSILWKNDGNSNFSMVLDGDVGAENDYYSFSGIWGDYNNDGFVDLFLPTGTSGLIPTTNYKNILFHNNGDGSLSFVTNSLIVTEAFDSYKSATWSDYDQDGDLDLTIAVFNQFTAEQSYSYFYKNQLNETGKTDFIRDLESPYAIEKMQAMNIRWVDYDNDGDFDMYAINAGRGSGNTYGPGAENYLYRNEGNNQFTKITDSPITVDVAQYNAQTWADFDNDGDLDLYLATQGSGPPWFDQGGNKYYENSGYPNYEFTRVTSGDFVKDGSTCYGFANGDYDNDGDRDLFVSYFTVQVAKKNDVLYKNEDGNDNNWIGIECIGSKTSDPSSPGSNRSGIGTKVRVKAEINGVEYWQLREIASNDGLLEQSDIRVHFGLNNATQVDSLVIEWPSGIIEVFTDVVINTYYKANEGNGISSPDVTSLENEKIPNKVKLKANYPNPFNPSTTISYQLNESIDVKLAIYNSLGQLVKTLVNREQQAGLYSVQWNGKDQKGFHSPSGFYIYELSAGNFRESKKMMLLK